MSYVLDNVSTQDAYAAALTLEHMESCQKLNLSVFNAAVKVSEKHALEGTNQAPGDWEQEYTVAPSERSLVRRGLVAIRFRSAVAGTPAQVTCIVFQPHES